VRKTGAQVEGKKCKSRHWVGKEKGKMGGQFRYFDWGKKKKKTKGKVSLGRGGEKTGAGGKPYGGTSSPVGMT